MVETLVLLVILKKRGRKRLCNNIMNNIKQNLQMPFQPWAAAHDFLGVLPKSFCSGCKHLPGFIGELCSFSGCVLQVTMVDLHACLVGFQLCSVWSPSCLARPVFVRKPPCFLVRRSKWQWVAISKVCRSTWVNWKRQTQESACFL